jgi:antitoxin (DNA-binding transcriptional repressor) of toxin-antitoxin stability system
MVGQEFDMREISLPQSDHGMAMIVRNAIARREPVTIVEEGKPVLDLVPRSHSWAKFHQTTPEERAAAAGEMDNIRAKVRGKLSIQEIISSKHEGHRH